MKKLAEASSSLSTVAQISNVALWASCLFKQLLLRGAMWPMGLLFKDRNCKFIVSDSSKNCLVIVMKINYFRSAVTIPCILMAWKPFRETKTCSSSLDMPRIGIRVPSTAPTTFGKLAILWKSAFIFMRFAASVGKLMFFKLLLKASITSMKTRLNDDWEIPCKSAASDWKSPLARTLKVDRTCTYYFVNVINHVYFCASFILLKYKYCTCIYFLITLYYYWYSKLVYFKSILGFSSPELKIQVSFSDCLLSVCIFI